MIHPNHEKIYEIIKEHGPISLFDIGQHLHDKYYFNHNEVAGYLSKLSKDGLIKNVARERNGFRKTSMPKIWIAK